MTRISPARLRQLADELPTRYTSPLQHLARARVLSGEQLGRLLATELATDLGDASAGRVRRRIMARLADLGLVAALDRRIGGARAGSAGHVHVLTAAGYTLAALLNDQELPGRVRRSRHPGPMFIDHALTIAQTYVDLVEASSTRGFQVATFTTEPGCWWPTGHGMWLKPDAYLVLQTPQHRDCWWLEIDRGTESLPRLADKCRTYDEHAAHGGLGPDNVLPRILFSAPNRRRVEAIQSVAVKTSSLDTEIVIVTTQQQAPDYLITELHKT